MDEDTLDLDSDELDDCSSEIDDCSSELDDYVPLEEDDTSHSPLDDDTATLSIKDLSNETGFVFPALLLSGILFQDTLKVIKSQRKESYRNVDVWLELEDTGAFTNIGTIQLTAEVLLVLRLLQVHTTLYASKDNITTLDLEDPSLLERYL